MRRDPLVLAVVTVLIAWQFAVGAEPAFIEGKWPFRPPTRPPVPQVQNAGWVANPIDAFILHALEAKGLAPTAEADKLTLLRRVTFDLTGLPPTVAEQQAFLADSGEDAYARLVERLLDSPRYGERWAQHWLDLVRYAETDGFKEDAFRPLAHKYRDYVIAAFNTDLPYDRFIRQQLAGDELEPDNPQALVATGLNRLYPDETNAANVRQRRQEIHDELTDTTALVFLGLTVGCAQCHDHKFDPITQVDYYRLQAFFAPLLPRDDLPLASPEQKRRQQLEQGVWEEATHKIRQQMDQLVAPRQTAAFQDALLKFQPDVRAAIETPAEKRSCMEQQLVYQAMKYVAPKMSEPTKGLKGDDKQRYEQLTRELADFDHLTPQPLEMAMAVTDAAAAAPPTHRLAVGDFRKPQEEVTPGFPGFLGHSEPEIVEPEIVSLSHEYPSSGRRAALARWLCRADHPLTARVMVNRIWQHHFGVGIVSTPSDFGAMGEPPTHPELLDWLAAEFIERGYSIKAMHRLLVTSAAYRQSSLVDPDQPAAAKGLELDPTNRLLWHARRRRLEGEALRDAMLSLGGQLQLRMFGPSARPELPRGVEGKMVWQADKRAEDRNRRSVYLLAKRNLRYPLFELFDQPDLHNSCPQRVATTTAPQALALLNSEFSLEQARHWAGRLLQDGARDPKSLAAAALREALAREPADDQLQAAEAFLTRERAALTESGDATADDSLPIPLPEGIDPSAGAAVVDFCHAVLNLNEFLYVD